MGPAGLVFSQGNIVGEFLPLLVHFLPSVLSLLEPFSSQLLGYGAVAFVAGGRATARGQAEELEGSVPLGLSVVRESGYLGCWSGGLFAHEGLPAERCAISH